MLFLDNLCEIVTKCKISFPWQFWEVLITINAVNIDLLLIEFLKFRNPTLCLFWWTNPIHQFGTRAMKGHRSFLAYINHSPCHREEEKNQILKVFKFGDALKVQTFDCSRQGSDIFYLTQSLQSRHFKWIHIFSWGVNIYVSASLWKWILSYWDWQMPCSG